MRMIRSRKCVEARMIHLYTGDGKGKTTAAVGLAVRAAGSGMRVIFSQFMKGNDTGELHALRQIPNVQIIRSPKQFGFYKTLTEEEKAELAGIHDEILDRLIDAVQKQECDMVILDEITYPVNWGLLSVQKLKQLLFLAGAEAPEDPSGKARLLGADQMPELVLTGRNPAALLSDSADYVTEMRAVRHPYEKGIAARKGIEY